MDTNTSDFDHDDGDHHDAIDDLQRPRTRADCVGGPRPCPWFSCRHHLGLAVAKSGTLTLSTGHVVKVADDDATFEATTDEAVEAWSASSAPTCVLDLVDEQQGDERSVAEIADAFDLSLAGAAFVIDSSLAKIRRNKKATELLH